MFSTLRKWLAGRILRARRMSPTSRITKALAPWAGRTIGKAGRDRWNQERRWLKVKAWANADEAYRDSEHAMWMAQVARQNEFLALAQADGARLELEASDSLTDAAVARLYQDIVSDTEIAEAYDREGFTVDPTAAADFMMLEMTHRNVAPKNFQRVH